MAFMTILAAAARDSTPTLTHYEAIVALLAAVAGLQAGLFRAAWHMRGWISKVDKLTDAIDNLAKANDEVRKEADSRFKAVEARLTTRFQAIEDRLNSNKRN